jgi:pimeloyl-ACP methyl ester carboxylesterase
MVRLGDRLRWSGFDHTKVGRTWSVEHSMTAPGVLSFLPGGIASRTCFVRTIALACLVLAGGCATPVGVERSDPQSVHRELTGNVLSTGDLSDFSQNVLRLGGITDLAEDDPEAALATIHDAVVSGLAGPNAMFAYAELAFQHASEGGGRPYYLASAVYAFAYLFPDAGDEAPSPFDPRYRWAVELYNLAITKAFETEDGARVELRSGMYELPFGCLDVAFDQGRLVWGDLRLTEFAPAAEFKVRGLRNRYRRPGLGAPLAAAMKPLNPIEGFQVALRQQAPMTAVLRIEDARRALAEGRLRGVLELYTPTDPEEITIAGRTVPLEVEPTASLAYGLNDAPIWKTEYSGFLFGDLLQQTPTQLAALQPHRPGRFPVVLVHGTASSAARWADVVNDLSSDPEIRDRFEFWFFSYETGNPIPYSALQLREALEQAVARLDPQGEDAALRDMVLIGHSQGGLLVKMTAIETGSHLWNHISRKPLDELRLQPATRKLLQQSLFLEPESFVGRVIFVATPHRGSYLAEYSLGRFIAGFVRLPFDLLEASGDVITNNPDAFRLDPARTRIGSIYGMTPGSPLITGLADISVAPGIPAHSIIAVRGDGPVEEGSDGVVRYQSAHVDGVESELVVRSGHSVQSNPKTVLELRRILLLHAEQACREKAIGCEPPALISDRAQ